MDFGNWEENIQKWAGQGIDALIQKKVTQPYELKKMQMQTFGEFGFFDEGQAGVFQQGQATGGISKNMILLGGAALLAVFFLVKD